MACNKKGCEHTIFENKKCIFHCEKTLENGWVSNDTRPVTFAIENLSTTHPSLPDTHVDITLAIIYHTPGFCR